MSDRIDAIGAAVSYVADPDLLAEFHAHMARTLPPDRVPGIEELPAVLAEAAVLLSTAEFMTNHAVIGFKIFGSRPPEAGG